MRAILKRLEDVQIPLHNETRQVPGYSRGYHNTRDYTNYPNAIFEDVLKIVSFYKTSSGSPYMTVESEISGGKYNIRWTQMKDFLVNTDIKKGIITGLFTFVISWNYYSLALVDPKIIPLFLSKGGQVKDAMWWEDHPVYVIDQ